MCLGPMVHPRSAIDNSHKETHFLIADDHRIFRQGLRMLLEAKPGFCVVGEASDGSQAVNLVRELKPDILLLDLAMPHYSGMAVLRDLANPPTPVHIIVLAAEINNNQMLEALELGAQALVPKQSATEDLMQSIHSVMAGQYWVEHESVAGQMQALQIVRSSARRESPRKGFGLTQRQLEVVEMIVTACSNREIAEKFSISEDTVKRHLTHIFDRLGVSNRLELVLFAIHHHLVGDS